MVIGASGVVILLIMAPWVIVGFWSLNLPGKSAHSTWDTADNDSGVILSLQGTAERSQPKSSNRITAKHPAPFVAIGASNVVISMGAVEKSVSEAAISDSGIISSLLGAYGSVGH